MKTIMIGIKPRWCAKIMNGSRLIDKMFPITMPNYPTVEKYIVMLRDGKPIWVRTPEGEKIDL